MSNQKTIHAYENSPFSQLSPLYVMTKKKQKYLPTFELVTPLS
jgi:hypothetical protein